MTKQIKEFINFDKYGKESLWIYNVLTYAEYENNFIIDDGGFTFTIEKIAGETYKYRAIEAQDD